MPDEMTAAGTAPHIPPPAPHYQGAPSMLPASLSISRPNVRLNPFSTLTHCILTAIVSYHPSNATTAATATATTAATTSSALHEQSCPPPPATDPRFPQYRCSHPPTRPRHPPISQCSSCEHDAGPLHPLSQDPAALPPNIVAAAVCHQGLWPPSPPQAPACHTYGKHIYIRCLIKEWTAQCNPRFIEWWVGEQCRTLNVW